MQDFKDKVAVITGAASGIGRSIADRCAQEGMKLVLADVEEIALAQDELELRTAGTTVMAVQTDVSKARDLEVLAQKTLDAFGAIHWLVNNAGVGAGTTVWESTLADWEWVIGVNLWGVIHGVRVFVPIMLDQNSERSRPIELRNEAGSELTVPEDEARTQEMVQAVQTGLSPQTVAEDVFNAIRNGEFYILTHPEMNPLIQQRMENILRGHHPTWA